MTLTRKNRKFWLDAFIEAFVDSKYSVYEIGKFEYKNADSARTSINACIRESGRENQIKVMTKGERVFLYKI